MVAVNKNDLLYSFEFVNAATYSEAEAYISLDTGKIYWVSDLIDPEEEIPADLQTSDRYVVIPKKVKRSVARHSVEGPRAYYEFIRNYV